MQTPARSFKSSCSLVICCSANDGGTQYSKGDIPATFYGQNGFGTHYSLTRKFFRLCQQVTNEALYPQSNHFLVSHLKLEVLETYGLRSLKDYRTILMAPGGRFLVTARLAQSTANDTAMFLQLWDIGISGLKDNTTLLASAVLDGPPYDAQNFMLAPSPEDTVFYLVFERMRG